MWGKIDPGFIIKKRSILVTTQLKQLSILILNNIGQERNLYVVLELRRKDGAFLSTAEILGLITRRKGPLKSLGFMAE